MIGNGTLIILMGFLFLFLGYMGVPIAFALIASVLLVTMFTPVSEASMPISSFLLMILSAAPCFQKEPQEPPLVAPEGPRSPAEQQKMFHLPPGFKIELVAAEPEIRKPMNLAFDHRGEGNGLRRLRYAEEDPGVLHRKKPLRNHDIEEDRNQESHDGHCQCRRLMIEHPAKGPTIGGNRPIEERLRPSVEGVLLCLATIAKQASAHHRRQGQRHDGRDHNGHAQRDCELSK